MSGVKEGFRLGRQDTFYAGPEPEFTGGSVGSLLRYVQGRAASLSFPGPLSKMPDLKDIFERTETVAVVGCSARPQRTSHKIARYLQGAGYRVVPVNPHYERVLGETCYPTLQSVPEEIHVDVVNIFRRRDQTAAMVRDALERAEQTGTRPAVWTQLGVSSEEAQALAEGGGLPYVKNRCIMVEHGRLFPEGA